MPRTIREDERRWALQQRKILLAVGVIMLLVVFSIYVIVPTAASLFGKTVRTPDPIVGGVVLLAIGVMLGLMRIDDVVDIFRNLRIVRIADTSTNVRVREDDDDDEGSNAKPK